MTYGREWSAWDDFADEALWPFAAHVAAVPEIGSARRFAESLALRFTALPTEPFTVETYVDSLGWTVEEMHLGAGGHQAMLLPRLAGGFHILVDSATPDSDVRARPEEREFRLAHELAHTLFYVPGRPPRRLSGGSIGEEDFCDAVADHLLGLLG